MTYFGIWVGYVFAWEYLVKDWLGGISKSMIIFCDDMEWYDTGITIWGLNRDAQSSEGMFVMATILTILTAMMVGTKVIDEIDAEASR